MAYKGFVGSGRVGNFFTTAELELKFPAQQHAGRQATVETNSIPTLYFSDGVSWKSTVTAETNPLTGGITGWSANGQTGQLIPAYRASRSPYVFGNAAIIDQMQSDMELWNLWCFGDSRTNGIITNKFAGLAPTGIPMGGVQLVQNGNATSGFTVASAGPAGGDSIPTSPYIGYSPDILTTYEAQTVGAAVTTSNNTLSNRLTYSANAWSVAGLATLTARLALKPARVRTLVRASSLAWSASLTSPLNGSPTMPNLYLQLRPNGSTGSGDAGYYKSAVMPIYTPGTPEYSVVGLTVPAGTDWTGTSPSAEHVCDPGITIGTGSKIVSFSVPWIELQTGILLREVGCVAGRSIAALLNEEVVPTISFTKAMKAVGGQHALWLAIGTNNPAAQTAAKFQSDVQTFIEKFRTGAPNAPVILVTNYPSSGDTVTAPYYVQALKNVALADPNVVVIDTFNAVLGYTAGVTAGYYSDGTHYNSTGQTAYANAYWSAWKAA